VSTLLSLRVNQFNHKERWQVIEKADQIMPLFVMDTVGSLPGLPGLFVAGVFSGALRS
jgi:hypothetical protein